MKKISVLVCIAFINMSYYSNTQASEWNDFINNVNENNCNNNCNLGNCNINQNNLNNNANNLNKNNYSTGQCDINQSDLNEVDEFVNNNLDDVDKFINDYMLENQPQVKEQYIPSNNFMNNVINNNNRKFSYDVSDKKYNALKNYQNNARNAKSRNRPSTADHYCDEFNTTYQVLPNMYLPKENIIINNVKPISRNNSKNNIRKYSNDIFKNITPVGKQPTNIKYVPVNNTPKNKIISITKCNNNAVKVNTPKVLPVQQVQNNKNEIQEVKLTDEQLVQLLSNKSPSVNEVPTININNNKTPTATNQIQFPKDTRSRNIIHNNPHQFLTGFNNQPQNVITNIQPVVRQNVSPNIIHHRRTGTLNVPYVPTITNYNTIDTNVNEIKRINTNAIVQPHLQNEIDINPNKNIINTEQQNIQLKLFNENKLNKIVQNNIRTYWENGITQKEVDLFLSNIKDSNAFKNMKMQIYSLLGDVAPAFGDPDHIRLLLDVIKYNKINKNEKHVYNYDTPLALTCVLIDYYINNVDLHNNNIEQFKLAGIDNAKHALQYNEQDYVAAIQHIKYFYYYYVINKIVKGINLIEDFKNNRTSNLLPLKQINLSNDMNKDWLTSTFQLFDYAIQCSTNSQDRIKNTNFAKFDEYLHTKSQHRDINEKIQFIPTLKDFVTENKEQFSGNKINSVLEALYKEEERNTTCYGIMGSIIMFRIFPELQTIFSCNQFGKNDCIIDLANKFYFSTNQQLSTQFNEQSQKVLDIAFYDNGRRLFNNKDYLIMVTNGLTRQEVINERKYISRYHERTDNNLPETLELYELVGVQLCSTNNVNYVTVSGEKLNDAVESDSSFGKLCISNNLKPMQALYKLISQEDYNKYMNKE